MRAALLQIWGPFSIQVYGVTVVFALFVFLWLLHRDKKFLALTIGDAVYQLLAANIFAALIGGRILHLMSHPEEFKSWVDIFAYWTGGLSILGAVLAISIVLPFYVWYLKLPVLPLLDRVALYTPLLQAMARFGCFFAGCCYGLPTNLPWAITYSDPMSYAPCGVALHPAQMYSSILLSLSFIFLYFYVQDRVRFQGQLASMYLVCIGIERFVVDFWRADREFHVTSIISFNQVIAIGVLLLGIVLYHIFARVAHDQASSMIKST